MSLDVKKDFPALLQKVKEKKLVYLDTAASALKPQVVIDRITQFYTNETANVHRGAHFLADQGTFNYESTRNKVKNFINAKNSQEIVFTKGTTDSLNLVVFSFAKKILTKEDEVILSEMEHHANLVPWLMLQSEIGFQIKYIPVLASGDLDLEAFEKLLNTNTKIVSVTHCSNTLGTINPIKKIVKMVRTHNAYVVVDGAQYIVQDRVDVQDLDCDFYAFSGHKIFGPYGVGVLYGKKELLDSMPPYQGGGSMIHTVDFDKVTFNDVPYRFEAGTPNISSVVALSAAIEYIENIGYEAIHQHEMNLLKSALDQLSQIPNIQIHKGGKNQAAIISMSFTDMHHSDVGQILDKEGVAVRVGHHCTQPLMKKLGVTGTVRASFSIYNTEEDIHILIKAIHKARELLT